MKSQVLSFCFALLSALAAGQNLVPNPSFEDTLRCPINYSDILEACEHWMVFKESPDYIHTCNPQLAEGLTNGKQAHTGNAYSCFLTFGITTPNFLREQIGVELSQPLTIGQKYFVTYYTSVGYTPIQCNIATNNVGVLFTSHPYYDLWLERPNQNYSHVNTTEIITEIDGWVRVSGSFVADSAYTHMIMGNFYDDAYTDTLNLPFTVAQQRAYYCVDDICVSTDSLYAHNWVGLPSSLKPETSLRVFPNPAGDFVKWTASEPLKQVLLFDMRGTLVMTVNGQGKKEELLDVRDLNSGMYMLQFVFDNKLMHRKIIIQH
jgi:hypothetical protein